MAQVARLEKKLEACLTNKEFYEAHQIYRTMFYRLSSTGKFNEVLALLETGIHRLADVGEFGSAYDLCEIYAETLSKAATPLSTLSISSVEKIFLKLPPHLADAPSPQTASDRRAKFVSLVVKWSQLVATRPYEKAHGSSELHARLARGFLSAQNLEAACSHFLLSNDATELASCLIRCQLGNEGISAAHWITIHVLQLLCLRRSAFAHRVFSEFTRLHPESSRDSAPFSAPFLRFSFLLIHIIHTRNVTFFSSLVARYHSDLEIDSSLKEYLDRIGQIYFGAPPKQSGGGILSSLLKGLMSSGNEENDKTEAVADLDTEEPENIKAEVAVFQKELGQLLKDDQPLMEQHDDDLD